MTRLVGRLTEWFVMWVASDGLNWQENELAGGWELGVGWVRWRARWQIGWCVAWARWLMDWAGERMSLVEAGS